MKVYRLQNKFSIRVFLPVFLLLFAIICLPHPVLAVTYFTDNMEGTSNWTADSPWAITSATGAYRSATKAWTDSPGGYYANNANSSLTLLNPVDLSSAASPQLVFWHKYQFEATFDFGYVEISTNGGTTWQTTPLVSYTGISDWKREQVDLTPYAGQSAVKIRFRLATDKSNVMDGWYIDDVTIAETPNPVTITSIDTATATSLTLSWMQYLDTSDFSSYKIYRSTTPGVTTGSTLAATVSAIGTITATDINLNPNTTYYYKVYVFNTKDLTAGSKEASGNTSIAQFPYPFFDNMEGSASGWTADISSWAVVQLDAAQSYSGYASKVWTDSPAGSYTANSDKSLQISVDMGSAQMPVLSFWNRYSFDENSDFGYVEVREVGTTTWKRLFFITGTSSSWVKTKVDLSNYAGKKIDLRFRIVTDNNGTNSDGWYIDDIKIAETERAAALPYPFNDNFENAETSTSNWHSSTWAIASGGNNSTYSITDSPKGNYGSLVSNELIMANTISLVGAVNPSLSFYHKYEILSNDYFNTGCGWTSEYDYGKVYLSTNKGQPGTWTEIGSYKGAQTTWQKQQIDLSNWAGIPDVRIKFVMVDNTATNQACTNRQGGWTIDDVTIEEIPASVPLTIPSSSMNTVNLSWTQNTNSDFAQYEIYRSSSPGVTLGGTGSTLIATISTKTTTTYTDQVAIVQPGTYYYKIWVKDTSGNVSLPSNEIQATYTVPKNNTYPFVEDGESGTGKWSFGSPWGLISLDAASTYNGVASTVWSDSPSGNYNANANTCMSTFLNLSGTATPVMTFWHKYSLEEGKDYVKLQVSTDNAQTWADLRLFTGVETTWSMERVNFTPYAGQANLGVRFCLTSDAANQQDGWYMDNLKVQEEAIKASYPFFDDMEHGPSPWFYDSPWAIVTLDAPATYSGVQSKVWTDSPNGSYAAGANTSLYLTIDLGSAQMPVLSFWHRYTFEANNDFGYVEVREVGTTNWQRLFFVTGTSPAWVTSKVDLSNYAGKQIDIRFRVVANASIQSDGWLIDDIKIAETESSPLAYPFKDAFENASATATNWNSSSWGTVSDPHQGVYSFADSPGGNYGNLVSNELITANTISLVGAKNPQLSFWHKYEILSNDYFNTGCGWTSEYDYGKVYLSTNKGQPGTWTEIGSYKGAQTTWQKQQIDLSNWAGIANVRIKFVMDDNTATNQACSNQQSGWTIDEISVEDAPVDTTLSVASSSMNTVTLSWTQNNDSDFDHYEIYRSSTAGVTRSSTLVATVPSKTTITLTDSVAIIQPGTYYYKMWVFDASGNVSMGSNEVQATYTVPKNSYPFSDNGEGGTAKWSSGTPWGLVTLDASSSYSGMASTVWTDSPSGNYLANASTGMTTFLNLSGTSTPVMTFWHKYSIENGNDLLLIEVSTDNGQTWTTIRSITGTETTWSLERINLTPYSGNGNLGLRFRLTSNGTTQSDGWYMDNLTIKEEITKGTYSFFDDMEHGIIPWFYDSPWGQVILDASSSYSGVASTVWTDSPNGSYNAGADTSLYLNIDLGSAQMPLLSFWHKYSFDANSDFGYVEVREVGTTTWQRLFFLTGTSPAWIKSKVDLSNYAGKQIDLRFRVVTDNNGTNSDGWYIDDVKIAETENPPLPYPFVDDMESAATTTNWHMSSWALTSDKYAGTYAVTDSPLGNYGSLVSNELVMANTIDLRGTVRPQLSFWHKYEILSNDYFNTGCGWTSEYDYGKIYLSTNKGQPGTWTEIGSYKGAQATYKQERISLSNWAGLPNVRIKFVMDDNTATNLTCSNRQGGWTVDDIRVGEDQAIPSYIAKSSGDGQTGQSGIALSIPFTAIVSDSDNKPRPSIVVTFAVTGGGGTISTNTATSGTDGKVSTTLTLGSTPGANTVTATVNDSSPVQSVAFTATGYAAGQAMRLTRISGDSQTNTVNLSLPNAFVVKVTDILGNAVPDVNVNFSKVSGDSAAALAITTPVATDNAGLAQNNLILGAATGQVSVSAASSGLIGSPVLFTAYAVLQGGTFGDTDGDGMPDDWEVRYGLSPNDPSDAALDKDNDGLTNLQEYTLGTDPTKADTDGDGLPDGWEVRYGLNPLDASDASKDANNDGTTNLQHYLNSTIPIFVKHYSISGATSESMDFYGTFTINGMSAEAGDEVAAICTNNVVCGQFTVTTPGQYGFMHVYKTTGTSQGDQIKFKVWKAKTGVEMTATPTVASGTNPPTWMGDKQIANVNLNGVERQTIPLNAGWNLISFSVKNCYHTTSQTPLEPMLTGTTYIKVNGISEVLSSIDGQYEVVRGFDSTGAHTFDPLLPAYGDLRYMAAGYAYWIKMKQAGNLVLSGTRASHSDTLSLHSGWNLVGYWGEDIRYVGSQPTVPFPADATQYTFLTDMGSVFTSITGKYSIIRSFDTGFHTYDPLLSGFNDLRYAGPGYGMWIRMNTVGTLSY